MFEVMEQKVLAKLLFNPSGQQGRNRRCAGSGWKRTACGLAERIRASDYQPNHVHCYHRVGSQIPNRKCPGWASGGSTAKGAGQGGKWEEEGIEAGHIVGDGSVQPQLQRPIASFPLRTNYERWVGGAEELHYAGEGVGVVAGGRNVVPVEVDYWQQPMTQAQSYYYPLVPSVVEVVVWRRAREQVAAMEPSSAARPLS
jgi:hypothetical protein